MPGRSERVVSDALSFSPGPRSRAERLSTLDARDFEAYPYERVAGAILAHPGTTQAGPPEPDWSHFAAAWRQGDRRIALDFMPGTEQFGWETGRPRWTGSDLRCDCLAGDILDLWAAIRRRCPAVWLYGAAWDERSGLLLSPRGFLRLPRLG